MPKSAPPFLTRAAARAVGAVAMAQPQKPADVDTIMATPVVVQVFFGAVSMPIADLMKLRRDAVVPLDHDVGDPVDVVVNGRVIARGDLVELPLDHTKIGVKLTEIIGRTATA